MNLIVFDLEWNMGNAPKTFNYHGAELTLRGEIIQIGAVRVDENGDVLDTFEMTLRPRIFRKLHWRIAEVTGLSQGDLEAGVPIAEGLRRFQKWAGPDAEFAEWGLDDVPVLKQNLFLYNMDESWPSRWYDLQQIFLKNFPRGEGEGLTLESVVDRLGIERDGDFHNALDDAVDLKNIIRHIDLKGCSEHMLQIMKKYTSEKEVYYRLRRFREKWDDVSEGIQEKSLSLLKELGKVDTVEARALRDDLLVMCTGEAMAFPTLEEYIQKENAKTGKVIRDKNDK